MKRLTVLCAACGVGKSTVREYLDKSGTLPDWACIDGDDIICWWDYAGTDREERFYRDCLAEAVRLSGNRHLLLAACMNPWDFYGKVDVPLEIGSTNFVALACSDEEVTKRLKARPEERGCGSDEFIAGQIEYNNWFRKNAGKFQLYIDNTDMTVEETAERIIRFLSSISAEF